MGGQLCIRAITKIPSGAYLSLRCNSRLACQVVKRVVNNREINIAMALNDIDVQYGEAEGNARLIATTRKGKFGFIVTATK